MKKYIFFIIRNSASGTLALLFICFLIFPLTPMAQSPGGISAHLKLWLKADAATSSSTDNAGVNTGADFNGLILHT
jgi:hypothetical protein